MPPEKPINYREIQSRSTENVTPEGRRFNETTRVAVTILNQRAEEVRSALETEGRPPQTDAEHAFYFFNALKNLPTKPEAGKGTPEPQNENPQDPGKPIKLRLIEKRIDGKLQWAVAQNQEGTGGQIVEVKALQYKDGDLVCFTGERRHSKTGAKIKVNYSVPAEDLMLAQLHAEQEAILNDSGLSSGQVDMLKLANESFKQGMAPIRDPKSVDTIAEGARSSGLLSRSSLEKFIEARGVPVPKDKLDRILGTDSIAKPNQVVEIFDAAGFFDKNQLKVMSQEAKQTVDTAQASLTTASQKIETLQVFEGKTVGDTVNVDGADRQVTQADIDTLTTAKTELAAVQQALTTAQQELQEITAAESQAADPRIRGELSIYIQRVHNGEVNAEAGLAFVRAVESNDPEGIFKAVMEEELKKIADEKAREAKRRELTEKYKKYNEKALKVGGVALMLLLMMIKDSAK